MPLLEAMAAEKPVLCSDIEILHEVAGDAALYFDPRRPEDIAAKINDLETTSTLRTNLVERGRTQVRRFGTRRDWALRYLRTFAQVVGSRDPQPRTRRPVHP